MSFSNEFNLPIIIAIFLFIITVISKYFNNIKLKSVEIPCWYLLGAIFLIYCFITGFLSIVALSVVLLFVACCLIFQLSTSTIYRVISGVFTVIIFLALGFHAISGFENQLYINQQIVKGNSSTYTAYINFDKSIAGLVFFLILIPQAKLPKLKQISYAFAVTLVTTTSVLLAGKLTGLIDFNNTFFFDEQFLIFFIAMQLFSTCLAEETFFRGFIQQRLYSLFKPNSLLQSTIPLIVASLLFGLVHFAGGIGYVIAATFAGIGYGMVYQITKRIEAAIIAHTVLNVVHLIFFTYPFKV